MAYKIVKFVAKVSIVGGTAYYTVQEGVWGTADEGVQAWNRLLQKVVPQASENISEHLKSPIPLANTTENWNTGMKTILQSVSNIPEMAKQYSFQASQAIQDRLKKE